MSTLEDKIGAISDAVNLAETLVQDFTLDTEGELEDLKKIAVDIQGDLECAETCETDADFAANLREAATKAGTIRAAIKAYKGDAPKDTVSEVRSTVGALVRELTSCMELLG